MQNIAEQSRRVSAPRNKAQAFTALKVVIEKLTDDQRYELNAELARLYANFMPAVPKRPASMFDWVAKCIAEADIRQELNYVHVTEQHITATDGCRIHRAPNAGGMPPGYYDKAGTLIHAPAEFNFPKVERYFTGDYGSGLITVCSIGELKQGSELSGKKKTIMPYYKIPSPAGGIDVQVKFLEDACSMEAADHQHHFCAHPVEGVVNGMCTLQIANLSEGRQVVLMPLRPGR